LKCGSRRTAIAAQQIAKVIDGFNCYTDCFRIAPWGLFGGRPGEKTRFLVEREGETIALESKVNFPLRKGDRLVIEIAGGGGYGDPRKRAREDVERDLREVSSPRKRQGKCSGSSAKLTAASALRHDRARL